jgi:hypothetical protein
MRQKTKLKKPNNKKAKCSLANLSETTTQKAQDQTEMRIAAGGPCVPVQGAAKKQQTSGA